MPLVHQVGPPPSTDLGLSAADVHVWRAFLDADGSYQAFADTLTADELGRAAKFVYPRRASLPETRHRDLHE